MLIHYVLVTGLASALMISAGVRLSLAISRKLSYISSIAQGGLSEIIFPTTGGKALVRQSGSLIPRHTNFYASKHCGFYFLNIYYLPCTKSYTLLLSVQFLDLKTMGS